MEHEPTAFRIAPGEVIAGKYRLERWLGEGGMGLVIAARHLDLDEPVAIKFLQPRASDNPEAVARFAREARASVKIKSEHVARTLDVGKLPNGMPYMVMEYLEGSDLGAMLRRSGPLPIESAADFTLQTCHALADAHAIGIIHRDLKPSNLFVIRKTDGTRSVKVLDFGISKITGAAAAGLEMGMTRTQAVMGSPLYMSPEQMASSRNATVASDIWALGITLFELLTARPPYEAETVPELCSKVLTQPTPRLRDLRPDAPEGLQAIIDRCLDKEPGQRYASVAELALALGKFGSQRGRQAAETASRVLAAAGMQVSSAAPSSVSNGDAGRDAQTVAAWGQTSPPARRRAHLLIALVALLLIAAVAVAGLVGSGSRDGVPAMASSPSASATGDTPSDHAEAVRSSLPSASTEPAVVTTVSVATTPRPRPTALPQVQKPRPAVSSVLPRASAAAKPRGLTDFGGRL